jgi:outer membrane protein assembly factor BamD (BamD/ComL family)
MPGVSADALFKAGLAYQKQARTADYDQSIAGDAINTFTDFITLYPNDARVNEARTIIASLKAEQAKGAFATAKYYEKHKHWDGARIYYNAAIAFYPESPFAAQARTRIEQINERLAAAPTPQAAPATK